MLKGLKSVGSIDYNSKVVDISCPHTRVSHLFRLKILIPH